MDTSGHSIPPFSALPLKKDGPPGNAWGLFGENDQLGRLNLLTPETTLEALKEVRSGKRISLDNTLDRFSTPAFSRQPFHQKIFHKTPRTVNDDILTLNTQSTSQWDGLRHFGYQEQKLYYNGCTQDEIHSTSKIGIHNWVENGGVIGRGVLLDYESWLESTGKSHNPLSTTAMTAADLQKVADAQNVTFKSGDILLIRSGFGKALSGLTVEQTHQQLSQPSPPAIGVESSKASLEWIWENKFAAVAGDMQAFECWPCQDPKYWMHEWLLAGWGVPIGEFFDLESLAAECKKEKKWTFFFTSVPLKVPGGVASPPNAVAIL